MAWTYSGDPANSDRDAVRFLIGDTDSSDQQLQDAEVSYLVSTYGTVTRAAAAGARALTARYARYADRAVGDLKITYSQRAAQYRALTTDLETQASIGGGVFAGGITEPSKRGYEDDLDRVVPSFRRGAMDHPDIEQAGGVVGSTRST